MKPRCDTKPENVPPFDVAIRKYPFQQKTVPSLERRTTRRTKPADDRCQRTDAFQSSLVRPGHFRMGVPESAEPSRTRGWPRQLSMQDAKVELSTLGLVRETFDHTNREKLYYIIRTAGQRPLQCSKKLLLLRSMLVRLHEIEDVRDQLVDVRIWNRWIIVGTRN